MQRRWKEENPATHKNMKCLSTVSDYKMQTVVVFFVFCFFLRVNRYMLLHIYTVCSSRLSPGFPYTLNHFTGFACFYLARWVFRIMLSLPGVVHSSDGLNKAMLSFCSGAWAEKGAHWALRPESGRPQLPAVPLHLDCGEPWSHGQKSLLRVSRVGGQPAHLPFSPQQQEKKKRTLKMPKPKFAGKVGYSWKAASISPV